MKASIIKIGNSHGIRIPKPILDQCGLTDKVELTVINQELIVKPIKKTRENWEDAFKQMAANKEDQLLESVSTEWEDEEWEWK